MELRAVAIAERRPADGFDFAGVFDLAYAAQLLAQNFDFARELKIVGRVLVVAAAAAREQRDREARRARAQASAPRPGAAWMPSSTSRRTVSPGSTKGASTTRPSTRASASPPYTHFSIVTEFATGADTSFTIEVLPKSDMKARVLSGIQPTGSPHIGNYLGALKNWAKIQYDYDSIYCIVDLHAVTVYQKPDELRAKIEELAGMLLAIGIDPQHSSLVVQSAIPQHAELAWMLTCVTPVGWLERMTQFKAKSQAQETIGDGLLQYPVLMAADILLYQAAIVPVGDDQSQHLELARDIAQRFNSLYGETFTMPATHLPTRGRAHHGAGRSGKKDEQIGNGRRPRGEPARSAGRDSQKDSARDHGFESGGGLSQRMGAGVRNLLTIFQAFTGWSDENTRAHFTGMRYGDLKKQVAEAVIARSSRSRSAIRRSWPTAASSRRVLANGAERVTPIAQDTVNKVKKAMGLYTA